MKKQLNAIKEFVEDNKKDLAISALAGFSIGMIYNYMKLYYESEAVIDRTMLIAKLQDTMLKNDKIMIDTQTEFIKFLQK